MPSTTADLQIEYAEDVVLLVQSVGSQNKFVASIVAVHEPKFEMTITITIEMTATPTFEVDMV